MVVLAKDIEVLELQNGKSIVMRGAFGVKNGSIKSIAVQSMLLFFVFRNLTNWRCCVSRERLPHGFAIDSKRAIIHLCAYHLYGISFSQLKKELDIWQDEVVKADFTDCWLEPTRYKPLLRYT